MGKILIFAGTTEGRELAQVLNRSGIACHVCVATEYGSQVMPTLEYVTLHEGRLDRQEMEHLYQREQIQIVVDATHPYATVVTDTILESVKDKEIQYFRLQRPNLTDLEDSTQSNYTYYNTPMDCAKQLQHTEGAVFLTTGSKDLPIYCQNEELRKRIVARVLPGMESLQLCYDNGLEGKQIIAMQGPFSQEMNQETMKQYNIRHMVTKESGRIGGVEAKLLAAESCGVQVHVIRRPEGKAPKALSMDGVCQKLQELLKVPLSRGKLWISLVGIGCGQRNTMTEEARSRIEEADYLFGAPRMLEHCHGLGQRYPYYLKQDILPVLSQIMEQHRGDVRIAILFSGDTGFYSGAEKMYQALQEKGKNWNMEVSILPGISSLQMFAAKIGISWQDAKLLSFHGVKEMQWIPQFLDALRYEAKTLFLTSGAKDMERMRQYFQQTYQENATGLPELCQLKLYLGYNLSYDTEAVHVIQATQLEDFLLQWEKTDTTGLCVGALINTAPFRRPLVAEFGDEAYLRDRVPMTKEEVRKLAISQLELGHRDVVYDIGAGSGSIALQIGALSPELQVYALECNPNAIDLIQRNKRHLHIENVQVVQTLAPEGISELPVAQGAFIGGSKGNLREILDVLYQKNPHMRIAMTAVSMESIVEMQTLLKEYPVGDLSITQIGISKVHLLGDYHMLQAQNPVFLFAFRFQDQEAEELCQEVT